MTNFVSAQGRDWTIGVHASTMPLMARSPHHQHTVEEATHADLQPKLSMVGEEAILQGWNGIAEPEHIMLGSKLHHRPWAVTSQPTEHVQWQSRGGIITSLAIVQPHKPTERTYAPSVAATQNRLAWDGLPCTTWECQGACACHHQGLNRHPPLLPTTSPAVLHAQQE